METEIERLLQDIQQHPSQVRFTLRMYFVDNASRRVLTARVMDVRVDAPSDDVTGDVAAAYVAARQAFDGLPALQHAAIARWHEARRRVANTAASVLAVPSS